LNIKRNFILDYSDADAGGSGELFSEGVAAVDISVARAVSELT